MFGVALLSRKARLGIWSKQDIAPGRKATTANVQPRHCSCSEARRCPCSETRSDSWADRRQDSGPVQKQPPRNHQQNQRPEPATRSQAQDPGLPTSHARLTRTGWWIHKTGGLSSVCLNCCYLAQGQLSLSSQWCFFTMGKGARSSKGKECLGVRNPKAKCTRSRSKAGFPILMNKNCQGCGEQRCKAHCQCARQKTSKAQGRSAPRGRLGTTPAEPAASPPRALAPVGRASAASCELLETDMWYHQCCMDIDASSEVEVASYMYDNRRVHQMLLKRLRGRSSFSLNVYIDAETLESSTPYFQRSRLKDLKKAGANIYVCKGKKNRGSYHCKGCVVDRRYLYTGGANFTEQSTCNEEFCFKVVGPAVKQVLERLVVHRQTHKLWDGR